MQAAGKVPNSSATRTQPDARTSSCAAPERVLSEFHSSPSPGEWADFFDYAPIALHCAGPDGIIRRANRAELQMLGFTASEYVGHHIAEFHEDQDVVHDMFARLARGELVRNVYAQLRAKDGSIRDVVIDCNVLWKDGHFVHTRCCTRLVCKTESAPAMPARTGDGAAVDSEWRTDEILDTLGHDLRNPLAVIANATHALDKVGSREPRAAQLRSMIERQTQSMTRMIDDVLDFLRVHRGTITLQKEVVDLGKVANRAIDAVRVMIDCQGQVLTVSLTGTPLHVEGDAGRLEQALINLLKNASNRTEPGGHIHLAVEREVGEVFVRVEFSGSGMPVDARTPNRLMTQSGSTPRKHGKLEMDFALAQSLVRLHGGSITALNTDGGARGQFVVRLPNSTDECSARTAPENTTAVPPKQLRIVVVDDQTEVAGSICMLLEALGHEAQMVHSGERALDQVRRDPPDLMFIDLELPKMSGHELARRLRSDPALGRTYLVALSGYERDEDHDRGKRGMFDSQLIKPASLEAIESVLAKLQV